MTRLTSSGGPVVSYSISCGASGRIEFQHGNRCDFGNADGVVSGCELYDHRNQLRWNTFDDDQHHRECSGSEWPELLAESIGRKHWSSDLDGYPD